jgi:monoamine oxidase
MGGSIDLGASWIHGDRGNPLASLAESHGLKTIATDDESYPAMFDAQGKEIAPARQARLYALLKEVRASARERRDALQGADESVGAACGEVLKRLVASRAVSAAEATGVRHLLTTEIEGAYATDLDRLSLRHWGAGQWFEGANLMLPGGFGTLAEILAQGLDIRLSTRVEQLTHGPGRVIALMADGMLLSAEKAVVTLPLGVLKAGTTRFTPPLPAAKSEAIARLGVGTFNKVYLGFKSAFWPRSATWIQHVGRVPAAWPMFFNVERYADVPVLAAFNVGAFAAALEDEDV